MRATPGASIDSHEAYVDAIVLLVPGNPSGMEVGTDDLAVDGVVMPARRATGRGWQRVVFRRVESTSVPVDRRFERRRSKVLPAAAQPAGVAREKIVSATKAATVRLQGTTLYVEAGRFCRA